MLVLGLSYKADIDDDRESPSYEIIQLLEERGADVAYCDPYFPRPGPGRRHDIGLASVPLSAGGVRPLRLPGALDRAPRVRRPGALPRRDLVVDTRNVVRPEWGPRVVGA